ncbi:DUF2306 domain-containing protein [Longispora sp. K20-0274]|uniref:DUF2306 domain-containing protein n=1 Tax=Longispora sp. K20-0274 TaxID=3088255 RepID=UPI00399B5F75
MVTRTSVRRLAAFSWIAFSAVAIAVLAVLPYMTDSLAGLSHQDSQLATNYATRPGWARGAFYVHVVCGGLALLLSPLQFAARVRRRAPRLHRYTGRIVIAAIVLGGTAGAVLAPMSLAGPVGTAGFGTLAVLWVVFAVAAVRTARAGDLTAHRRWAVRTFAMTYAAVTLRLWLLVLVPLFHTDGVTEPEAFLRAYVIVPFLCWVPNLLVADVVVRRMLPVASRGRDRAPVQNVDMVNPGV